MQKEAKMQSNFTDPVVGKQSTGDLLSRLKTRKVLGVGETENGDVHRSKISQLLGHNEHLYMKLPKGWWAWHFAMATCLTAEGALLFFFPSTARQLFFPSMVTALAPIETETSPEINLQLSTAHQCHGAALLGVAFLLWKFFHSKDRAEARATTSAVGMYHFLLAWAVLIGSVRTRGFEALWQADCYMTFGIRTTVAIISALFNKWIGSSSSAAGIARPSFRPIVRSIICNACTCFTFTVFFLFLSHVSTGKMA